MWPVGVAAVAAAEAEEECHILKTPDLDLVGAAVAEVETLGATWIRFPEWGAVEATVVVAVVAAAAVGVVEEGEGVVMEAHP